MDSELSQIPDLSQHNLQNSQSISNDIFLRVFHKLSEFLTLSELKEILVLNKTINRKFFDTQIYYHICCLKLQYTSINYLNRENIIEHFIDLTGLRINNCKEMFKCLKNTFNMIKNPYGAEGFNDWGVIHGGDQTLVENWGGFKDHKTVFATSYRWGTLRQSIKIPSGNKRILIVGPICNRRWDCGSVAKVYLRVNGKSTEIEETMLSYGQVGNVFAWRLMKIITDIDCYEQVADVEFRGKDTQFWAGTYGARFGHCFAMTVNCPEDNL